MSTEVSEQTDVLPGEATWTGRIFSDGWVDAPETIESVEPATGEARHGPAPATRRGGLRLKYSNPIYLDDVAADFAAGRAEREPRLT